MAFDKRSNFAYSTIKVAPTPATSGTTLSVQTGDGALFNATPPYNAFVFPANTNPTKANTEIVRITAISTDTFTITRTQEGSPARAIATGDQIIAGLTDKALTDIETALTSAQGTITTNTGSISTISNQLNGTSTGVTLNQPTIADYTNAQHTHANASQGGSLGTGIVQANNLATNAITLGYAQITSNFTTTSTTAVQVTSLTATINAPGSRRVKITAFCSQLSGSSSTISALMTIWDGTVGSGTQLAGTYGFSNTGAIGGTVIAVVTPSAGTKTYNVGLNISSAGTAILGASSVLPAIILVEAI